jgi:hypothetical protein
MAATHPKPTTRRRRRGAVALVGGLALLAAACGGGGGDDEAAPSTTEASAPQGGESTTERSGGSSARLVEASDKTAQLDTGRMRLNIAMDMTLPGQTTPVAAAIDAEGSFDNANGRAEITMDLGPYMRDLSESMGEALPPGIDDFTIAQVVDGDTIYMKSGIFAAAGVQTEWVSLDAADLASGAAGLTAGFDPTGASSPSGFVESLRGVGADVAEVGSEEIDGADTTIYEGTIDPSAAVANAPEETRDQVEQTLARAGMTEIPFRAWVDEDDVVRRMELTMEISEQGMSMSMVMTMELFDLGEPVEITPPPASAVTPFSEVMGGAGAAGRAPSTPSTVQAS